MSELVRDWKAERKDLEVAFDIISDKLIAADAEIERLKKELHIQKEFVEAFIKVRRQDRKLITKLADALDKAVAYLDIDNLTMQNVARGLNKLSKQAREATKDE